VEYRRGAPFHGEAELRMTPWQRQDRWAAHCAEAAWHVASSTSLPLTPDQPRAGFMTREQVAEELPTCVAQVLALMKRRELEAVQIGGRRQ
jgi:hypothetical protein